uniref:DUF2167 domain-containing protein n=1 Tax=Flavobacterium sp. TaxID=239 RepID=UPI00404A24DE
MKKTILTVLTIFLISFNNHAQEIEDFEFEVDSIQLEIENIEKSLNYKTGIIDLDSGNAQLKVPKGFRFLDKEQSNYVLSDLWGNPSDSSILGMLVPENRGVLEMNSWVFTISFDEMGFVKDDDADDVDYDDLLAEQQKEFEEINPQRIQEGYQPIQFVGWAADPFYDKDKKVLHWAKELKFGDDDSNTLNYNLRILGRKGVFILNAVATMNELPEVNANLAKVIASVHYKEGHKYADFNPDVDNVAAWTIGGLVAGKILAKAGFFVLLAKFWKVIALAVAGGGGAIWNYFKKNKKEDNALPSGNDEA